MNHQIEVKFFSNPESEAFARMVISAFITRINPTLNTLAEIRTAVSEAVTNAIVHAYENDSNGAIIMQATLSSEAVFIEIEDFGCGIEDIALAMQPFYTSQPSMERTGMGFSLMLSFMDQVHVGSTPGEGTKVSMTKLLQVDDKDVL